MAIVHLSAWSAMTLLSIVPKTGYISSPAIESNLPQRRSPNPIEELLQVFTSLCSQPIPHARTLDWNKMLGHWFLDSVTMPTGEPSQCVRQTFDQVDKRFGWLEQTMLIVPESAQQPNLTIQLKTFVLFDAQSDPNTLISVLDTVEGEKLPIETIILETDYTSYIIGYECSGQTDEGSAFEHMAIMTRSPTPLSPAQQARLIRRAFHLIPAEMRSSHKFYQVSKAGCGLNNGTADKREALNLLSNEALVDPKIFNTGQSRHS